MHTYTHIIHYSTGNALGSAVNVIGSADYGGMAQGVGQALGGVGNALGGIAGQAGGAIGGAAGQAVRVVVDVYGYGRCIMDVWWMYYGCIIA